MTRLRKIMLEELQRRNYADTTIRHYLRFVERFAQHFGKSPDKLGSDHLRTYQAYLLKPPDILLASDSGYAEIMLWLLTASLLTDS
jgi:hypothetical protein